MLRLSHPVLIRLAAVFIALQALWSSMATTAYAAGFDAAKYMCGQVMMLDAEARQQIAELAALTGLEDPQPLPVYDPSDCVACALGQVFALNSEPPLVVSGSPVLRAVRPLRIDQASPRQPVGPPVGLRAPPFTN